MHSTYQIHSAEEYASAYKESVDDPETFWGSIAENFLWKRKWTQVLRGNFRDANVEWFCDAQLNITENCIDRHLEKNGDDVALIWEPNDPTETHRSFTYRELHEEVCVFANVLKSNGAKKGDRICIYLPMIPELAFAVLACARIGAIHSVVFGGFSAQSITERINDAQCNIIITADGGYRGAKEIQLKEIMDEALEKCSSVNRCIVIKRTAANVAMRDDRDVWYDKTNVSIACEAEVMDAEDMLFILYTSGSTGKPKGVVHTCGGYMVYANYSFVNVFQHQPGDIHFCTADIGWITGHSYILYGPLSAGAATVMFEGIPVWPDAGRLWEIVEKHKVNSLYTAPTAIRSLMAYGSRFPDAKKMASLKVLGTVGEPINEEAWHWYDKHVGKNKLPIVDTWWQTETGGIMISNLAGITPAKPSFATWPLPGIVPVLLDEKGNEAQGNNVCGNLAIKFPWPGMFRTTYGDHDRFIKNYFETYPGYYFTGDGALRDESGNYRITGRVDDVLNVSGHRLGTAEVENAINVNENVVESAVVGFPHQIKGEGIYAFVILQTNTGDANDVRSAIIETVAKQIGAIAKPDKIQFVSGLPKTRSGKIMRRILRKIAEGETENLGDITTLLDPGVVEEIKQGRI